MELRDCFKNKLSSAQGSDVMVESFHDLVADFLMPLPLPSSLLLLLLLLLSLPLPPTGRM